MLMLVPEGHDYDTHENCKNITVLRFPEWGLRKRITLDMLDIPNIIKDFCYNVVLCSGYKLNFAYKTWFQQNILSNINLTFIFLFRG